MLLFPLLSYAQPYHKNQPSWAVHKRGNSFTQKVDSVAKLILKKTGVPSASIAVVKNGKIIYVHAYGYARLHPKVKAQPDMRYGIGSISKQFAAASILYLEQEGKISLNDKIAKWLPKLTKADEVTVREVLSHTSGYRDYYPQDYTPVSKQRHITPMQILHEWAEKPLDFPPGTKWQYSNTNYTIIGEIIEKISGETPYTFITQHFLKPLHITNAVNYDRGELTKQDAKGYMRYGIGPLHPIKRGGGYGWMFGAGELAMTSKDLAKWDLSIINESLLEPQSYKQLETDVLLKSGVGTGYALGLFISMFNGHRMLSHSGEVSGFTAENMVFPDDGAAVAVLTNQDASSAAGTIARQIAHLLFKKQDSKTEMRTKQAENIFKGLQKGTVNRSFFTHDANVYFDKQALHDFKTSLAPLGNWIRFVQTAQRKRGGMLERVFRVVFPNRTLRVWTYQKPNGKLEQYQIAPVY